MANLKSLIVNGTARFFGTVYGVFNGSFTGNLAGKSTSSDKLNIIDTRSVNSPPSYYQGLGMGVYSEFKTLTALGISSPTGFCTLNTYCAWKDSTGGLPYQEVIPSASGTLRKFRRIATSTTEWGVWEELDYAYKDMSNINKTLCQVVISTYKNGNSWWRLWSDGWCEQGGQVSWSNNSNVTIGLHKNFKDTTYDVHIQDQGGTTDGNNNGCSINSSDKAVGSFAFRPYTSNRYAYWVARGYVS